MDVKIEKVETSDKIEQKGKENGKRLEKYGLEIKLLARTIKKLLESLEDLKISNENQTQRAEEQYGIILEEVRKGNKAVLARTKAEAFPQLTEDHTQPNPATQNKHKTVGTGNKTGNQ